MLYKRKGLPDENEIVLCKVTKIYPNSVFVDLLEFNDSGMIHISEVSPGRIRNLRDFVSVGRQVVCKVLRINRDRGHIDLSLRRVNSMQRRDKLDEIKQELKAENLIKTLGIKLDRPWKELYGELSRKIFVEYSHLHLCFKDLVSGEVNLVDLGIDKELADEVKEAVLDKFKPKVISIQGEINIQTYHSDGVDKVKNTLIEIDNISKKINLFYLGAGRFKLIIEDVDYKPAEKNLKKIESILDKFTDKKSTASFERDRE